MYRLLDDVHADVSPALDEIRVEAASLAKECLEVKRDMDIAAARSRFNMEEAMHG